MVAVMPPFYIERNFNMSEKEEFEKEINQFMQEKGILESDIFCEEIDEECEVISYGSESDSE